MAAHKNPEISILQIGGDASLAKTAFTTLAQSPDDTARFSKFVFAGIDTAANEDVQAALEKWKSKTSYVKLGESLDLKEQNFQPSSFDIVITVPNISDTTQRVRFLQDVEQILEPGGLILVLAPLHQGLAR